MRRLDRKNQERLNRISYLHNKRRLVSKEKAKRRNRLISGSYKDPGYTFAKKLNKRTQQLVLPEQFGFESNYEDTTRALHEIRSITEHSNHSLHLDFSEVAYLESTASLALAAEIYRWKKQTTSPLVSLPDLWNPKVKKELADMGLFQLLNLTYSGEEVVETEKTFVKFVCGDTTDGESVKKLRTALEQIAGISIEHKSAFGGITEAMNNVIKHAYPQTTKNERIFGVARPWWLGGSYNRQNDTLTITICDQGVGIPKTLPRTHAKEKINDILNRLGITGDDADMIKAALELGRTATHKTYQGKGLQDIKRFVDSYENASLKILSLRGEYLYLKEKQVKSEKLTPRKSPFHGTIIEWRIKNISG